MDPMGTLSVWDICRNLKKYLHADSGFRIKAVFSEFKEFLEKGNRFAKHGLLALHCLTWPMAKLSQLFGITYLVGKIKFKLFFFRVHWLSEF